MYTPMTPNELYHFTQALDRADVDVLKLSDSDIAEHVLIVLCKKKNPSKVACPYVIWKYSKQDGGFYWGEYFAHSEDAHRHFAGTVARLNRI